ncbi:hypothetical protein D3C73_355830 [compost metagenome]
MSDYVEAVLVRCNGNINEITKVLKKKKYDSYIMNDDFRCIVTFKEPTKPIIDDLIQTFPGLIHLVYGQDYGWSLELYEQGNDILKFEVDFEKKGPNRENIGIFLKRLRDIGTDLAAFQEFGDILSTKNMAVIERKSWAQLLKALELKIDNNFSYDFLENQGEGYRRSLGLHHIQTTKSLPIKRIILRELSTFMNEKGYYLTTDTQMPYEYSFFKLIAGIEVGLGLHVDKVGTRYVMTPNFKTLFTHVVMLWPSMRSFDTEEHLTVVLQEIKKSFEEHEIKLKEDLVIEDFDKVKFFEKHVDPFMSRYGLKKKESSIEQRAGGRVIYTGNKTEIHFEQGQFSIYLGVSIQINNELTPIESLDRSSGKGWGFYHNQYEYLEIVNTYLQILEQDYLRDDITL